jgi:acetyl-CoA C-acetyltransferase
MADFDSKAPVLVAAGEASGRLLGLDWPSPSDLAGAAIKDALADSGQAEALAAIIDCVVATRSFEDSGVSMGTGSPDNVPESYAKAGGIFPRHYVYADVGGQTPQAIIGEYAGAVRSGLYRAVLIAGAEANASAKRARKHGHVLNWRAPSDTAFENRLSAFPILSRTEIRHGIISMPLAYSLIETARRIRCELSEALYETEITALWAAFSEKSLMRKHAQFAQRWTCEDLQKEDNGNYRLTHAYRRWMVAQDAVDLGAALILTTAGIARDIGIAPDKMIWLAGAAEASEPPLSERVNLSGSQALEYAVTGALDQAGFCAQDIGPLDIYSCFPCAVFAATDTLDMPDRPLTGYTLTGGLSFFGGPGNGYSLHGLAAMMQELRRDGSRPAMITSNGGVMSKQAVGIYTARQPDTPWMGEVVNGYAPKPVPLEMAPCGKARILTYARPVTKGVVGLASIIAEMENGTRAMAVMENAPDGDLASAIITVTPGDKRNAAALQ